MSGWHNVPGFPKRLWINIREDEVATTRRRWEHIVDEERRRLGQPGSFEKRGYEDWCSPPDRPSRIEKAIDHPGPCDAAVQWAGTALWYACTMRIYRTGGRFCWAHGGKREAAGEEYAVTKQPSGSEVQITVDLGILTVGNVATRMRKIAAQARAVNAPSNAKVSIDTHLAYERGAAGPSTFATIRFMVPDA